LLADERVRRALPNQRGAIRIIGRWILSGFADGLTGFVREYDRDLVASEGVVTATADGLKPLGRDALSSLRGGSERVLLLVHGTFSNASAPVDGLGRPFMEWARQRYRAVIALDHWTLSKTPLDNARLLVEQLRMLAPELLDERRLDIVTHSRGGLVARSFCLQPEAARAVRNVVFMGTPNCGTDLANPDNWGAMADALINMTGLDHSQLFGKLAGLLARLAVWGGQQAIPGLLAQNPLAATLPGEYLNLLQQPLASHNGVRHAFVTSEFEPTPLIPNLRALWQAAKQAGLNAVVDKFFNNPNDLVVNTANVWCMEQAATAGANLPGFVDPERVLAFVPPRSSFSVPTRVRRIEQLGVHHNNLYAQPGTQDAIKLWLE
jgi:pimeloyl-ACP methyl ester carboxylesterase